MLSSLRGRILLQIGMIVLASQVSIWGALFISYREWTAAEAINLAGSLRMKAYRLSAAVADPALSERPVSDLQDDFEQALARLQQLLDNYLTEDDQALKQALEGIASQWQLLAGYLDEQPAAYQRKVTTYVGRIDRLVSALQLSLEQSTQLLVYMALFSLLLILVIAALMLHFLHRRLLERLQAINQAMVQFSGAEFSYRLPLTFNDELTGLCHQVNAMAERLSGLYRTMESRIEAQTADIQRHNDWLTLDIQTSQLLNKHGPEPAVIARQCEQLVGLLPEGTLAVHLERLASMQPTWIRISRTRTDIVQQHVPA